MAISSALLRISSSTGQGKLIAHPCKFPQENTCRRQAFRATECGGRGHHPVSWLDRACSADLLLQEHDAVEQRLGRQPGTWISTGLREGCMRAFYLRHTARNSVRRAVSSSVLLIWVGSIYWNG